LHVSTCLLNLGTSTLLIISPQTTSNLEDTDWGSFHLLEPETGPANGIDLNTCGFMWHKFMITEVYHSISLLLAVGRRICPSPARCIWKPITWRASMLTGISYSPSHTWFARQDHPSQSRSHREKAATGERGGFPSSRTVK